MGEGGGMQGWGEREVWEHEADGPLSAILRKEPDTVHLLIFITLAKAGESNDNMQVVSLGLSFQCIT